MPLKTNVGVSRKVSDNNYGSCGASVNLEVELDSTLINEPDRFHERIRQVFRLAKQAIDEELTRQQQGNAANGNGHASQPSYGSSGNGHNGNGTATNGNGLTTTSINFADGSNVSMTGAPPATSASSTTGAGSMVGAANVAGNNLIERLIQMQAQLLTPTTTQSVTTA